MADTKTDQEKRRDKALKRALSTPSRQHKDDVGGRLFEGFEKGVKGLFGEHVHFIYNINFIVARWGKSDGFVDASNVVDTSVGGAVDFEDIERLRSGDFLTKLALIAGLTCLCYIFTV